MKFDQFNYPPHYCQFVPPVQTQGIAYCQFVPPVQTQGIARCQLLPPVFIHTVLPS
jgi:hypothetical protein